jgi:WhiB family redox-sensing transcriptional regulator
MKEELQNSNQFEELTKELRDTAWMHQGKCVSLDPAIFFPSDGAGVEVAKKICRDCEVRDLCLRYALSHRIEHGVWGGTSERQRRRILKQAKLLSLSQP